MKCRYATSVIVFAAIALAGVLTGTLGIVIGLAAWKRTSRLRAQNMALVRGYLPTDGTSIDSRAIRNVGVVRYDAFQEMTGMLSFSLALLNLHGDGVVLTSINGRTETRTYAKALRSGRSSHDLSPEEQRAVRQAWYEPGGWESNGVSGRRHAANIGKSSSTT